LNILIVNIIYPTPNHPKIVGGAERSVKNLAEALVKNGHDVLIIRGLSPEASQQTEYVGGVKVAGFPIPKKYWPFDGQEHGFVDKALWHIADDYGRPSSAVQREIEAFAPDVIHTNNLGGLSTAVWSLADKMGIGIVHTLRDYYLLCPKSTLFRGRDVCGTPCTDCSLFTMRRRALTGLVDVVVGNSQATLDLHLERGLFANAAWKGAIHNVSERVESSPPADPKGPVRFGYIGRVTVDKGVEELATAYGRLATAAELIIAGEADPAIQERLQQLAGSKPIKFLGFVTPDAFYSNVDVVVAPSLWHEPLPRSILEAFAYGRPALGSTRGGIPEALGDGGWLFDPADPPSLERSLDLLARNPDLVRDKALVAAELAGRFRPNDVVEKYLAAYERARENRRATAR
jgi:glycosyltransferase involved in cell wall biosynthesis